jgi:sec-independent protein translocase protein TatA
MIALVFFGPKRLPEIGGAVGKSIKEFKKGATELEDKVSRRPRQSSRSACFVVRKRNDER